MGEPAEGDRERTVLADLPGDGEPHGNALDVLILLSVCVFLVLDPPDVQYLSYRCGLHSPISGDVLGGALTGLSTLLLLTFFVIAMYARGRTAQGAKLTIVTALAVVCIVLPTVSDMLARHERSPSVGVGQVSIAHDGGVLQTEAAIGFLLRGESPYSANYGGTEMAQGRDSRPELWRSLGFVENPAYHFYPYPPLTFLLSLPLKAVSSACVGWFDQRMVHLTACFALGILGYLLPASPCWRLPLMTLLVFNPIAAWYFVQGRNDILCLTLLVAMLFALTRRRYGTASLLLGLACGMKQLAWLMVPFFLAHVYGQLPPRQSGARWRSLVASSWPLGASILAIFLPFLLWDPEGLFNGLFVAQASVYPFRSSGLGFANFLILFEAVREHRDRFPLVLCQVLIVLPLCVYGLYRESRRGTVSSMLLWYSVVLLLFLFLGRHFAHNYLAVVFSMMAVALALNNSNARQPRGPVPG